MKFIQVKAENFRNISFADVLTDAEDIVLTGINGQGKTNFLEIIYLLCYGSSFRTSHLKEAIKHGENSFSLSAITENDKEIREHIRLTFSEGKRRIERKSRIEENLFTAFHVLYFHMTIFFLLKENLRIGEDSSIR